MTVANECLNKECLTTDTIALLGFAIKNRLLQLVKKLCLDTGLLGLREKGFYLGWIAGGAAAVFGVRATGEHRSIDI
jgi:hypothetical protein